MPRPQLPATFVRNPGAQPESLDLNFALLTPMLGGSAKAGSVNESTPFRTSELKHQLRFWWRALQRADSTIANLREQEAALFGGAAGDDAEDGGRASLVKLQILNCAKVSKATASQQNMNDPRWPKYGVGPLLQDHNASVELIEAGCEFTLRLEFSPKMTAEQRSELETALRAALFFGGLGARTRRGFGSLYCETRSTMDEWEKLLASFSRRAGTTAGTSAWPSLHGATLWMRECPGGSAADMWRNLLNEFGNFRQQPGVGRSPGAGNRPGRSYWPEPDSVRTWLPFSSAGHPVLHPSGGSGWYPRAAFGLPLSIHFKANGNLDPIGTATITPPRLERWPSPVFLKVIRLNTGKVIQACLWLNQRTPDFAIGWKGSTPGNKGPATLPAAAGPDDFAGKIMINRPGAPVRDQHPVAALAEKLALTLVP